MVRKRAHAPTGNQPGLAMYFQSLTESMKDYRKRVVEAMVQVALNFQSAFRGSSPETQEQYKQDFQVWQEEQEKKAHDPGYVPQPLQPLEDELFFGPPGAAVHL